MGELEGSVYRRESMFERLTVQASLKVLQFQVFQNVFLFFVLSSNVCASFKVKEVHDS